MPCFPFIRLYQSVPCCDKNYVICFLLPPLHPTEPSPVRNNETCQHPFHLDCIYSLLLLIMVVAAPNSQASSKEERKGKERHCRLWGSAYEDNCRKKTHGSEPPPAALLALLQEHQFVHIVD